MAKASNLVVLALRMAAPLVFLPVDAATAQSYSPLLRPYSTNNTQYWYCRDQYGRYLYNCPIDLRSGYYAGTNAHWHEQYPHKYSSIRCVDPYLNSCSTTTWASYLRAYTSITGSVGIYVGTTLVGQAEYVYGSTTYPCGFSTCYSDGTIDYAVGYSDVFYNHHPEIWVKIGGTDTGANTGHGTTDYNRYMKLDAPQFNDGPAYRIYYATLDYLAENPGVDRICLNDMALPFGGKFDICNFPNTPGCTTVAPWDSPHIAHDRGTAVDVATTGDKCTKAGGRLVDPERFKEKCMARGGRWSRVERDHVHCAFEDPSTFPH